jgi:hypothetical protein
MGAVFALGSAATAAANPQAAIAGMRITFAVAALLVVAALVIAAGSHASRRASTRGS